MASHLHLFAAYGIELEYMLVDRQTLAVAPVCDRVLAAEAGEPVTELERGPIGWSNELAAHVIELKTSGPTTRLDADKAADFTKDLRRVDELAATFGARVLPTAMHPLMDPARETILWSHEGKPVYAAYDRIFGCSGHGWSNLQSCHLNLPFHGDQELHRLHSAIRPVLTLLPGLAASSPIVEGKVTGVLDTRLQVYRNNQRKLGSIIGKVVPEAVTSAHDYEEHILKPMYREIAPLDPEGLLQHEWLNSRGAIARFDRGAIEIRLLDVQETPRADLAIARLVAETVRALAEQRWVPLTELDRLSTTMLAGVLDQTITRAEHAVVESEPLLRALGYDGHQATVEELWTHLAESLLLDRLPAEGLRGALVTILGRGTLASRITKAVGPKPSEQRIIEVYGALADCALEGQLFVP
ncbi:carboxylate-amine ligase [Paraliomyxa miuraensis]|uniref:carboxylate-amine ligase n=1 Tax=Paraliomyxa miuraensis TaxID=376150 RepID=UPI00224F493B|nr:glutamate-cysteine ligase family protein [Paraliomyxa miuraensis]MCX4244084.1 glutamate-cysteine ligase family protein [Paraliomyxa miuraensis]